jgi:hypothetical protein
LKTLPTESNISKDKENFNFNDSHNNTNFNYLNRISGISEFNEGFSPKRTKPIKLKHSNIPFSINSSSNNSTSNTLKKLTLSTKLSMNKDKILSLMDKKAHSNNSMHNFNLLVKKQIKDNFSKKNKDDTNRIPFNKVKLLIILIIIYI